jgi:hypothetical protein
MCSLSSKLRERIHSRKILRPAKDVAELLANRE